VKIEDWNLKASARLDAKPKVLLIRFLPPACRFS
jgi:hypothetical protein